jgi:hypothetical protein
MIPWAAASVAKSCRAAAARDGLSRVAAAVEEKLARRTWPSL